MAFDTGDADKAASLVHEAQRNYEKASKEFGAVRQGSLDAQVESRIPFDIKTQVQGFCDSCP